MKLETETGTSLDDPSAEQIETALKQLVEAGGGFAILSQSDQVYIQTAENGMGECTLEYREGSEESHYRCPNEELSIDRVISAFQDYARSGSDWKSRFQWRPLYMDPEADEEPAAAPASESSGETSTPAEKSGCLGMILLLLTAVCAVCLAIVL